MTVNKNGLPNFSQDCEPVCLKKVGHVFMYITKYKGDNDPYRWSYDIIGPEGAAISSHIGDLCCNQGLGEFIADEASAEARLVNSMYYDKNSPLHFSNTGKATMTNNNAIELKEGAYDIPTANRLEVINESGRLLVKHDQLIKLLSQDNGQTIKIFIKENEHD